MRSQPAAAALLLVPGLFANAACRRDATSPPAPIAVQAPVVAEDKSWTTARKGPAATPQGCRSRRRKAGPAGRAGAHGRRTIPSEANFLMIDVGADVKPAIDAFEARGIRVGRRFAALPTWLRVTIGTREETGAFLAALRTIVPARSAAV